LRNAPYLEARLAAARGLGMQQPEAVTILTDDADGRAYADALRPILEGQGE